MRTISLMEHSPQMVTSLSNDELSQLLALRKYVTLRPVSVDRRLAGRARIRNEAVRRGQDHPASARGRPSWPLHLA